MPIVTRTTARASKANARRAKAAGAGSSATQPRQSASILSRIGSAAIGFVSGGPAGAIAGALTDPLGRATSGGGGGSVPMTSGFAAPGPCPRGRIQIGRNCIDPLALPPGGRPAVVPSSGTEVTGRMAPGVPFGTTEGAFGIPARIPRVETRIHRECGPGFRLGKDDLCYPKGVLGRRSKFRKWRPAPKPPVTSADVRAIRRAARVKDRVANLGRDVGLSVSKTRRKSAAQIKKEAKMELLTSNTPGVRITKVD